MQRQHLQNGKRHESEPPAELTVGWFARLQLSDAGGIIYPPPLYWIPAVKCKLQPLRKRRRRRRWRMAPEAPEQPMNLWLMSRLISRRATSALVINLPSPAPSCRHLAHASANAPCQWMETSPGEIGALVAEAALRFSGGLKTRQLARSQLPPNVLQWNLAWVFIRVIA